ETVAPPVPDFLMATSATGLLESASNPSGTSPASASRGLTNRPPSTRVAPTDGGGRTFAKGGIADGLTRRRASCRETAAPRSMFPRATATRSVEGAIFDCAPIDHPSGFGPLAAWSCQQGWTSFITLETFCASPSFQAVVQRSERTPLGPSTTVYASPDQCGAISFATSFSTQASSASRVPSSPMRPIAIARVPAGGTGDGSAADSSPAKYASGWRIWWTDEGGFLNIRSTSGNPPRRYASATSANPPA